MSRAFRYSRCSSRIVFARFAWSMKPCVSGGGSGGRCLTGTFFLRAIADRTARPEVRDVVRAGQHRHPTSRVILTALDVVGRENAALLLAHLDEYTLADFDPHRYQ